MFSLNLFNELGKRDKMRGLPSILSLFRNEFNKFNNTRARMLDSIYHMTNTLKSHFWGNYCYNVVIMYVTLLLRSAMAGRLYKLQSKHTSNSGFDQTFMPSSGYILFAAEQRVGYQISWVDLQREGNCP